MKNKNILKGIVALSLLTAGFSSCERADYPDRFRLTDGKPSIDYIRYADKDVLIERAYMNETVCVVGQNLTSITQILFNDQAATLNTSYMTDKTLLVSIPKTQPKVQTNQIYFVTQAADTVTVDFEVMPPAPIAREMDCEYAKPGTVTRIYGDYFIDMEYVEFQGNNARVEASDFTYTQNTITLTVPLGATPGMVKVKSKSGLSGSIFHYMDQRGMLFDFDDKANLLYHKDHQGWHPRVVLSDETSISGNFVQLGDGTAEIKGTGEGWDDNNFSFEYWPGSWEDPETFSNPEARKLSDFADFSNYANMAYKFELYIPVDHPWTGGALQIIPASVKTVHNGPAGVKDVDGNELGGQSNKYIGDESSKYPRALYMPWVSGMVDTGGRWITVTIPMISILYQPDGKISEGKIDDKSFDTLVMFLCNSGGFTGQDCRPILKIDNIRAVPIK